MNTCEQCKQEYKAKRSTSRYCSDKCRQQAKRGVSVTELSVTELSVTQPATEQPTLTPRTNPQALNYGEHLTAEQLAEQGLKANRVPIPGDSDYSGACELVDGQWRVKQCA